jgi:L-asparagine oxygenase
MATAFRSPPHHRIRPPHEYHLDKRAAGHLLTAVTALVESGVRPTEPEFYDRHWMDLELLPVGLRDFLWRFRMTESHAACVIHGLPTSDAETPPHWNVHSLDHSLVEETILALCAMCVGDPFARARVQNGRMVQNILPTDLDRRDLHTENGSHCDYLAFLGMSESSVALASVRDLDLDDTTREVLAQKRFRFADGPAAVLSGDPVDPYLRLDRCLPVDPDARQALDRLLAGFDEVRQDVALRPGSLLLVDNYRVAHGRLAGDWLKRILVSRNLRRVSPHPRILT